MRALFFVLVAAALLFGCQNRAAEPAAADPPQAEAEEVEPEELAEDECIELRDELREHVDGLPRVCSTDAECVTYMPGCPFGCFEFVSKSAELDAMKERLDDFSKKCAILACDYKCAGAGEPVCSDGKCVEPGAVAQSDDEPDKSSKSDAQCKKLESRIDRKIAALDRSCKTVDDCEEFGPGCPFGCFHGVAKTARSDRVQKRISKFREECPRRNCKYKCKPHTLECKNQKCVSTPNKSKPGRSHKPLW